MSPTPPSKDAAFEAKRQEWIRCLGDSDPATGQLDCNSVMAQVYDLIWNAAAYRVVLEARRIADKDAKGQIKLHGLTHQLIDRCFHQSQLVAIRRLMDNYPLSGPKGVFSLKGLVSDLKQRRQMFTRRNVFAAFNCALDVEAVRAAELAYCLEQENRGLTSYHIPCELDANQSRALHEMLDRLCGVDPATRTEEDVVAASVFDGLEDKLTQTERICEHVNKFLAHAATPESRARVDADTANVTYKDLREAHEIICRTCQFIDCFLLRQTSHSFLAIHSGDLFQYVDQPLAITDRVATLRETWVAFETETSQWSQTGLDWIV